MNACEVLREVDQVIAVALNGRVADPGVVAFDRVADQLLVGDSHAYLLGLIEEPGGGGIIKL